MIWKQSRLERRDWNGAWRIDRYGPAGQITIPPGQWAKFYQYDFMWLTYDGVYRVSYDIRWYVNGRMVGSAIVYHSTSEIIVNAMENQQITSDGGCTMDV